MLREPLPECEQGHSKKYRPPRIITSTCSKIKSELLISLFGKIDQKHHKLYHVESNPLERKETDQNNPKRCNFPAPTTADKIAPTLPTL